MRLSAGTLTGFVSKHWRGDLPVLTSMLGVGVFVVAVGIGTLRLLVMLVAKMNTPLAIFSWVELARYAAIAAILTWAAVGIWRSAGKTPTHQRWTARAIIGAAGLLLLPIGIASAKSGSELFRLALNRDPLGPPARVQFSGSVISLRGPIAEGTANAFLGVLRSHPDARTVVLSSIGGRIAEARQIANAIRTQRLDTFVADDCDSACTEILVAGTRRSAATGARIGFHQATMEGNTSLDDKLASEGARDRYLSAGIDPKFVGRVFSTSAADLWVPSTEELLSAGVLTDPPKDASR